MFYQLMKYFKKEESKKCDLSKLILYLNQIFTCLDYHLNDMNLSLSNEDIEFVYLLSLHLTPDLFLGKIFFPIDQFNSLTKDKDKDNLESLIIEEHSYKIHQIFYFDQTWLNEYYFDPMNKLNQLFCRQKQKSKKSCILS